MVKGTIEVTVEDFNCGLTITDVTRTGTASGGSDSNLGSASVNVGPGMMRLDRLGGRRQLQVTANNSEESQTLDLQVDASYL